MGRIFSATQVLKANSVLGYDPCGRTFARKRVTEFAESLTQAKYTPLQRVLHWAIALAVLGVLAGGLLIGFLGFKGVTELLGTEARNLLYKYHKTFGLIILAAMVLRLVVKARRGAPAYNPELTPFQAQASSMVHKALYLALLAMPVLGWLATDALNFPVEFFNWTVPQFIDKNKELGDTLFWLHGIVGWAIVGLLAVHIGAALFHAIVLRDSVLKRML